MARFKIEGPAPLGEYGIEYVVNPLGAIVGIHEDHPAPSWPRHPGDPDRMLVEVAQKREDGWRLATDDEIRAHCEATGDWLPPSLEKRARSADTGASTRSAAKE